MGRVVGRGLDGAPRPCAGPATRRFTRIGRTLSALGESMAAARAEEAYRELARHDHRLAAELRAAAARSSRD